MTRTTTLPQSGATYQLRRTPKALMIDKLTPEPGFDPPMLVVRKSFGPFGSKTDATKFMLRHGGRP
jgi:hypothetical protein